MKKLLLLSMSVASLLSICFSANAVKNQPRDTYNYELKKSQTVVYRGINNRPHDRSQEHVREGKKFTHMNIVGNVKTRAGAQSAESRLLDTYRKNHGGKNPKYNKTNHG